MAINRPIDPASIDAAPQTSGKRTKKAAFTTAFVARRRQKGLLTLMGRFEWDESFDFKQARGRD